MVGTDRRFDVDGAFGSRNGVSRSCISAEYELPEDVEGGVDGVTEAVSLPPAEESALAVSIDVLEGSRRRRRGRPSSAFASVDDDAFSFSLPFRLLLAPLALRPSPTDPSLDDDVDAGGRVDEPARLSIYNERSDSPNCTTIRQQTQRLPRPKLDSSLQHALTRGYTAKITGGYIAKLGMVLTAVLGGRCEPLHPRRTSPSV